MSALSSNIVVCLEPPYLCVSEIPLGEAPTSERTGAYTTVREDRERVGNEA